MDKDTKVVIFCGGRGTRLKEKTEDIPKPLVPIGNMPILWHIMKGYETKGFSNFVLCLGYQGEKIKDFFMRYSALHSDFTINTRMGGIISHNSLAENWNVTLVDTGLESETGYRLGMVSQYLEQSPYFMVTYGDGVSDVDVKKVLKLHQKNKTLGTITGFHERSRYGKIKVDEKNIATSFVEKPILEDLVNGGFMIFNREFLKHPMLKENVTFEEILENLTQQKQLSVYLHNGFFHPMDTIRDYEALNKMWENGDAPWKKWK
ncbi:MAG: sugar phosphate nucleotidyltransferase [Nanoarchaeota archaeon]|nr:sugar phosphate nucleotidyltransferase [Nanoarchaeota archaeon]